MDFENKKAPAWVLLFTLMFVLVLVLRGTLRRYFFEHRGCYRKKLPYSRLWQTAKPDAALRLRRRTVLPLAKQVLILYSFSDQNKKAPVWVLSVLAEKEGFEPSNHF